MSTTPGERRALLFLGAVAVLGGVVRLRGDEPRAVPSAADVAALERQLRATDSAAEAQERPRRRTGRPPASRPETQNSKLETQNSKLEPPPPSKLETQNSNLETPPPPLDLDRASAAQLESLPGIGPALAARIVAARDSAGGLGSLEALDRVRGVGPALLARLAPVVTFSAPSRPSNVENRPAAPPAGARGDRRVRRPRQAAPVP